ncbi:trypsin epsilon [Bombyx mori]
MRRWEHLFVVFASIIVLVNGKIDSEVEAESGEKYDSEERIGPAITQINRHPYVGTLIKNGTYICSAVILNTYWLATLSDCFDRAIISSYVTHKNLGNFAIRAGSSYNNKGGTIHKIKLLINNFDLKVSAVKLDIPLEFGSQVDAARLPSPDQEVMLGYLASMTAWTPTGHIRLVNAPVIDASICEEDARLLPGHYICVGGVQDPNRHFCRQDNGGAVIQNDTLIAVSSFLHTCAVYTKTHAFPKVSSFSRWLDSVIWDEGNRPTTTEPSTTTASTTNTSNTTEISSTTSQFFAEANKFMLTLPFDPINVPLEPAEDNSVIPHMSLYESYLQNLAKEKTSTTTDPSVEEQKKKLLQKYGKALMKMPAELMKKKIEQYEYK